MIALLAHASFAAVVLKGERHHATNFLATILSLNFENACPNNKDGMCATCVPDLAMEPSDTTYCCWKHGYASSACPHDDAAVLIVRSPYSWLTAMYEQPYEYNGCDGEGCGCGGDFFSKCACGAASSCGNFSNFLRSAFTYAPWDAVDSRVYVANDSAPTPVDLWNAKAGAAASYDAAAVRLTHLMLYVDRAETTRRLLALTELGYYNLTVNATEQLNATGNLSYPLVAHGENSVHGENFTQTEFDEIAEDETSNAWLEYYTQEDLDWVNARLDPAILEACGVERVWRVPPEDEEERRAARRRHTKRLVEGSLSPAPLSDIWG